MKKSLLLAIILFCCSVVFAQSELLVESKGNQLYVNHTVVAKENFYSIGRLFNVSPKEIAAFNGLDMSHGLTIGQIVKIPLTASNFSQSSSGGRPVFYVVGPKEGLYRVSTKNNNVLMANLRKWNNLSNDNISAGKKLIVGYLVSAEAGNTAQTSPAPAKSQPVADEQKKTEEPKDVIAQKQETVGEKPAEEKKEIRKTEPDKKNETTSVRTVSNTAPGTTTGSTGSAAAHVAVNDGNGGYFKSQFDQQVKVQPLKVDETVTSGIFKTASGWQDGKYYALMDHVEPGTIIKIINPSNNKAIYAKVLGEMSGIRQNQGFNLRMSNAAASALEITDTDKFIVRVNY